MNEQTDQLESILADAVEIASESERRVFVAKACAGNVALQRRIEELIENHFQAGGFLESPLPKMLGVNGAAGDLPVAERPGSVIGQYQLVKQLGEGGFGVVFVAEQRWPVQRQVALKVIKPGMDTSQVVARFEAERQALAMMDHPGIARVFDGGQSPSGRPYFVMELVRGFPITEFCEDNHLSVHTRLNLFAHVCDAVQHAHQKGVIHRDLKPSNIMVATREAVPAVKVIDFGIAKATGLRLTEKTLVTNVTQMLGTPMYMSPEQAQLTPGAAGDIDTRTDIYALGVLLYELLTGATPFDKERLHSATFDEIRRIIREEEPPKPSTRLTGCGGRFDPRRASHPGAGAAAIETRNGPSSCTVQSDSANRRSTTRRLSRIFRRELDWIVMKAIEKDRNRRYETVAAFAADVRRYLDDQPILACPPAVGYRLQKFVHRHKGPASAAGLVLLAVVIGIIGTTVGLIRAERQWLRAEAAEADAIRLRDKAITAAAAESLARESAQNRLVQIEKGNEILTSIFNGLNPRVEQLEGKPLRAILGERLDDAVQQLNDDAIGDLQAVARLQRNLALALMGLGYTEKAIPLLTRARETFAAEAGADSIDTLQTMKRLGEAYLETKKLDLALALLEDTLELANETLGSTHAETIRCRITLGGGYRDAGKFDVAVPMLEETLRLSEEKFGHDHPSTLEAMKELGLAYRQAGRPEQALSVLEGAYEFARNKFGPEDQFTLSAMQYLAAAYTSAGRPSSALPLLEEAFRLRRESLGRDHPRTILVMNDLANCYADAKQFDLAVRLLEDALNLAKTRLGPDDMATLTCLNNLAQCYRKAGKNLLAFPLLEESRQLHIAKLGPDHHYTIICTNNLAAYLRDAGNVDRAIPLFQQASLAWNLLLQSKCPDAEPVLRESLAICQRTDPNHWTTSYTQSLLGASLLGQERFAEAEPYLLEGYEGMRDRQSENNKDRVIRLNDAASRLVQLYEAWNQPDQAAEWRAKIEKAR